MDSIDINPPNLHEKPWDTTVQQNEDINLVCTRRQKGRYEHGEKWERRKKVINQIKR
jgi:hypothetical protein